jgi:hypothetical protein
VVSGGQEIQRQPPQLPADEVRAMKRPGFLTYLFGNPLSAFALLLAMIYFVYEWWSAAGSGGLAFIAFLAAGYAMGASDKLQKYQQWKREWDAMEGKRARQSLAHFYPALRIIVGLAVWCFFAYLALAQTAQPGMQLGADLFWLATLVIIGAGVFWWLWRRRGSRPAAVRDVPVTQCLPLPGQSTTPTPVFDALPKYCLQVIQKLT